MARVRKNEMSADMNAAASAPVRRRTVPPARKRTPSKPDGAAGELEQDESLPELAVAVISEPALVEYAPAHEEIAALAYAYWLERGCFGGDAEQDWLRAEGELRQRAATHA
jgi:hypothetical protein